MPDSFMGHIRKWTRHSRMARLLVPVFITALLFRFADCCHLMESSADAFAPAQVHAHADGHADHEAGGPLGAELCSWMDSSAMAPLSALAGVSAPGIKFLALVVTFLTFAWLRGALRATHAPAHHPPPVPRLPLYLRSARLRI